MELYTEIILDLAKNPLHQKVLSSADLTGSGVNTTCGDHVRLYLTVSDGRVTDASWQGEGCAISVASVSVLTDMIRGKKLSALKKLCAEDLFKELGIDRLGPARVKCVTLCLETLHKALHA